MKPELGRKKLAKISLSTTCKAIVIGSLLGDGSLKKYSGYKNARLSIRHSITQEDYFLYKVSLLEEIAPPSGGIQRQKPSGFSKEEKLLFQSSATEELTAIYESCYVDNKLEIQRKWLNHLTPLGLLIWWLDDGSIIGNGRKGVFCTDGFSHDAVCLLGKYLDVVWGVYATISPVNNTTRKEQYRLWLSTEELKKFIRIVALRADARERAAALFKATPKMLCKIILLYKEPELQQRWISELKEALPESVDAIDVNTELKRQKWKDFRK